MFQNEETFVPGSAAKTLRPSEALRIGAALRPQCFNYFFKHGQSCALGAMYEGYGNPYDQHAVCEISKFFKTLPLDAGIVHYIASMNNAGVTREAIADWLELQGL